MQQPGGDAAADGQLSALALPPPRVRLFYNPQLSQFVLGEAHPMQPRRLHLVHKLLEHTGLLKDPNLVLVSDYPPASIAQLRRFHSKEYIEILQEMAGVDFSALTSQQRDALRDRLENFGLSLPSAQAAAGAGGSNGAADAVNVPGAPSDAAFAAAAATIAAIMGGGPPAAGGAAKGGGGKGGGGGGSSNGAVVAAAAGGRDRPKRAPRRGGKSRSPSAVASDEPPGSSGESDDEELESDEDGEGGDCPLFPGLLQYAGLQAAGSVEGARSLVSGAADIAIHWGGGMHHGHPDKAYGFCYVNDLVLAVSELLPLGRVMYIDIDVHHGDGVEDAFRDSCQVMSISLHKWEHMRHTDSHGRTRRTAFFPGTGAKNDKGEGPGQFYTVNVPLSDHVTDDLYYELFSQVVAAAFRGFQPQAVVLQCGCDSVAGDQLGCFNLSIEGHGRCVEHVRQLCMERPDRIPLLVTGGGGYTPPLVARCWAYETAVLLGRQLPEAAGPVAGLMPEAVAADPDLSDLGPDYFREEDGEVGQPEAPGPYAWRLDATLDPRQFPAVDSRGALFNLARNLVNNIEQQRVARLRGTAAAQMAGASALGAGGGSGGGSKASGGGGADGGGGAELRPSKKAKPGGGGGGDGRDGVAEGPAGSALCSASGVSQHGHPGWALSIGTDAAATLTAAHLYAARSTALGHHWVTNTSGPDVLAVLQSQLQLQALSQARRMVGGAAAAGGAHEWVGYGGLAGGGGTAAGAAAGAMGGVLSLLGPREPSAAGGAGGGFSLTLDGGGFGNGAVGAGAGAGPQGATAAAGGPGGSNGGGGVARAPSAPVLAGGVSDQQAVAAE